MLLHGGKAENTGSDNKEEVDMKINRDPFHQDGFKPGFAAVVYKKQHNTDDKKMRGKEKNRKEPVFK